MQTLENRVLYVSEDEGTSELLTVLLATSGYYVLTAPTLVTAQLVSRAQTFNMYVIDAQFWGGEGTELCRIIRGVDPLSPVILHSSDAAESARREALDAGATFYILKPDIGKLIEAVSYVTCDPLPEGCESRRGVRPRPLHAEP